MIFLLLLFHCGVGKGYTTNINTDTSSLFTLKSHIKSDPQNMLLKNWTTETSVCSWVGVGCDSGYNRVTKLNISFMGLVGTIPPEIGNLSFLVSLRMNENSFHGPIPPSVFDMPSLRVLSLRKNSLSGRLPDDMCKKGVGKKLKRFHISFNELYGEIPSSLGQCSHLQFISLFVNNFSGHIPKQIGNITLLQKLYLGANNLTGNIPKEIGHLNKLEVLNIASNTISGALPTEIGNMTAIRRLWLFSNNLNGSIPSSIGNLSELRVLALYDNKLSGEIPSSACSPRFLQVLQLSNNSLEGAIPECLGKLSTSMLILHLGGGNRFSGLIPSSLFTKGCSLQSLTLNGNKLEGPLPKSLINCQALLSVDIGDNEIRDMFPVWMETLPQLRVLVLRSNKFNGTIPISNTHHPFSKLQVLDISGNAFTGSLPEIYFKNFRGMVDAKENLTNDETTNLFRRFIELTFTLKGLDQSLQRLLTTFTTIDLSLNTFSGSIPSSIGYLNSLRYLNLSHNNALTGHIPASLANITVLESLDLSTNHLSGRIPQKLAGLTFLAKLNLSSNNLVGQIPQSRQFNTFDNSSYMGNSGLCGVPLTKLCGQHYSSPPVLGKEDEDDESGFVNGFGWQAVALGYGIGFIIGVCQGYFILRYERPKWLVELFFDSSHTRSGVR